jgi:hypothetical protein
MRIRILGLYALLALAAAGYTAYWFHLAGRAQALVDAELDAWRGDGIAVSYTERRTYGYPYRLSTEVAGLALERPAANLPWQWRGERLTVYVQPWNLRHYVAVFEGASRLILDPLGRPLSLDAVADSARASVVLDDRYQADRGSADLHGLVVRGQNGDAVQVGRLQAHARRPGPGAVAGVEAALFIDRLLLPEGAGGLLGREVALVSADATFTGPVPARLDRVSVTAWRDAGGTVEAHALSIRWGPVEIDAEGTLALDSAMRPLAALTARVRGFGALIDILEAERAMGEDAADAVRVAMALIAVMPPGETQPVLEIPVTIQDGWLSAGPVPVVEVGPVFPSRPRAELGR